ncbi:hypothetical protein ACIP1T_24915 [Pseudomonas japonica]|uniref:hypothetical protein n=1 Tax=Pseudomonas japonica TaxID=256466 RepID=UPI0037F88F49
MAEFFYRAHTVDGSRSAQSGVVTAADKREAESKVKAKYSYAVRVAWLDDAIPQLLHPGSSVGAWADDSMDADCPLIVESGQGSPDGGGRGDT